LKSTLKLLPLILKCRSSSSFISPDVTTGESKVTLFGDIYPVVSNMINSGDPLIIAGKLELGEEGPAIILSGSVGLVSKSSKSLNASH
jgi:hypothetical protein